MTPDQEEALITHLTELNRMMLALAPIAQMRTFRMSATFGALCAHLGFTHTDTQGNMVRPPVVEAEGEAPAQPLEVPVLPPDLEDALRVLLSSHVWTDGAGITRLVSPLLTDENARAWIVVKKYLED